ncbi:MAG TPA: hypothetical protein VMH23_19590 [Bacteroidota bacterium]|nr:hypothetical protein [Bacteroidota bacterium]
MRGYSIASLVVLLLLALTIPACQSPVSSTSDYVDAYLHVRASWSPDGKTIAFTSAVQNATGIYVMDTLGGNIRQVIAGTGVGANWSPDGKWIAFSQDGILYKIKPTGDSLTKLTDVANAIRPAWSPDGSKIAFVQTSPGFGIWVYDVVKGTATMMLTYGDFPTWNRQTKELVILNAQFDQSSGYVYYSFIAVDSAFATTRSLGAFTTIADIGFSPINPAGNKIAFGVKSPTDYAEVWIFDLVARTITQITTDGGDYPSWSPDGTRIIYTRTQPGDGGLWIMGSDGSNKRRVTKP